MPGSIPAKQKLNRKYKGPKIIVEQSKNFPVPIKISIIKANNRISSIGKPTEVNFLKTVRFRSKHDTSPPPLRKFRTPICRWFRRKRALNQLINEHKKEVKAYERRKQAKFEQERLKDFIRWESLKPKLSRTEIESKKPFFQKPFKSKPKIEKYKYVKPKPDKLKSDRHKDFISWESFTPKKEKRQIEKPVQKVNYTPPESEKYNVARDNSIKYMTSPVLEKQPKFYHPPPSYELPYTYVDPIPKAGKKYKAPVIVARECRGICINEAPAKVQPKKKSKSVYVKKYNHRESFTNKFVNWFYRICCQFYCYLTCIIIIACIVICII